jgi:hypothetical protein
MHFPKLVSVPGVNNDRLCFDMISYEYFSGLCNEFFEEDTMNTGDFLQNNNT